MIDHDDAVVAFRDRLAARARVGVPSWGTGTACATQLVKQTPLGMDLEPHRMP